MWDHEDCDIGGYGDTVAPYADALRVYTASSVAAYAIDRADGFVVWRRKLVDSPLSGSATPRTARLWSPSTPAPEPARATPSAVQVNCGDIPFQGRSPTSTRWVLTRPAQLVSRTTAMAGLWCLPEDRPPAFQGPVRGSCGLNCSNSGSTRHRHVGAVRTGSRVSWWRGYGVTGGCVSRSRGAGGSGVGALVSGGARNASIT